jgi:hypothetical protein
MFAGAVSSFRSWPRSRGRARFSLLVAASTAAQPVPPSPSLPEPARPTTATAGQHRVILDLKGDGLDLARCDPSSKRRSPPSAVGDGRLLVTDVAAALKAGYRIAVVKGTTGRFVPFGSGLRITLPRGAMSEPETGWALLAIAETTRDGLLDSNDLLWPALRLARDANGDGVLDEREVETLAANEVTSVGPRAPVATERDKHGNELAYGSFGRTDRTFGRVADVALGPCTK